MLGVASGVRLRPAQRHEDTFCPSSTQALELSLVPRQLGLGPSRRCLLSRVQLVLVNRAKVLGHGLLDRLELDVDL